MVCTADLPYAAGGLDPRGQGHTCFHTMPLDHLDASDPPAGRAAGYSGGGSTHRHRPPYHAYSLNLRECCGAYDPPDHRPPPFDGHQPDHRAAPVALPASRRPCLLLRHIAVRDTGWTLPASCRRLIATSAGAGHGERLTFRPCRRRRSDPQKRKELLDPSTCDQELHYLGDGKRSFSSSDHGKSDLSLRVKPPLVMPMEVSPWDDGYKSPTSPTYYCEDVEQGSHGEDKNENPGWLDSDYDGSAIAGRDPNFKTEDLVLKTQKEDSAYNALVDDFMDAVMKSWCSPKANITVDKEAHQKQADRFAELALKRYNRKQKQQDSQGKRGHMEGLLSQHVYMVKYALVEAIVGDAIFEGSELYGHVNFYAKAKNGPKKNDGKVLVFAELRQIGRRLNAMVLTCFQLLDEKNQLCIKASISATSSKDMQHESTVSTPCTIIFSFKGTYHESTVTCFISWAADFSSVTSSAVSSFTSSAAGKEAKATTEEAIIR
ncbi:hypothetical protein C2845_PM10G20550 [Panicum miliaceum]|uniref:DUF3615 domain-containing protein n=1 Tax=Panicum miliaceum TaxID=4540 RepID=A0A3L6PGM6_PANMI|nr:hypothetical protein C2845_PM10G20550 [Panicum miliaceum]